MFILCLNLWLGCAKHKAPNIAESDPSAYQVPEPEDFKLGKGDKIAIRVWRHPDLDMDITIARWHHHLSTCGGNHSRRPHLSRVGADSHCSHQRLLPRPSGVSECYRANNQKVFVLGAAWPHQVCFYLQSEMTVLEALTRSGGLSATARTNNVLLIRGGLEDPQPAWVNVASITNKGQMDQMIYLKGATSWWCRNEPSPAQRSILETFQPFLHLRWVVLQSTGTCASRTGLAPIPISIQPHEQPPSLRRAGSLARRCPLHHCGTGNGCQNLALA